jgi:hypothetical protein
MRAEQERRAWGLICISNNLSMKFICVPVIDRMLNLYSIPIGMERFNAYIALLEGEKKGDMSLPIVNYNPMAKPHVSAKLQELKTLGAEKIISDTLLKLSDDKEPVINVVLNLADDLMGGWTNRYTTDYDSRFRIQAFVKRNFCAPLFWSSENYSEELIAERTIESCRRMLYRREHEQPVTLEEHIRQENFVLKNLSCKKIAEPQTLQQFYEAHKTSENFITIFNFLYGDEAAEKMGYAPAGIKQAFAGFYFAAAFPC